jgi:hypothetical protein
MSHNKLGDARRSAVIMNFGPGAVVDFRVPQTGAPASVVAGGLEMWDQCAPPAGLANRQTIYEPRLQKKLDVGGFRLPPVSETPDEDAAPDSYLVGVRFPGWLVCPECEDLKLAQKWTSDPGDPSRYCSPCSSRQHGNRRVFTVPVRFVIACENGHLDDFPWQVWVRHRSGCSNRNKLKLLSTGAGLAGLQVKCMSCKSQRSLENIFKRGALRDEGVNCSGRRPWLTTDNQDCNLTPTTLQRGASNLYYPQLVSALDIPPWSDNIQKALGQFWDSMLNVNGGSVERKMHLEFIWNQLPFQDRTVDEIAQVIENRIQVINEPERENLRWDEYRQLCEAAATAVHDEFDIRAETVPTLLTPFISRLVRVMRLREVRALTGFTRIDTPRAGLPANPNRPPARIAFLSAYKKNWLPAIEVRGEGIFFELDPKAICQWEEQPDVLERVRSIAPALVDSMSLSDEDKRAPVEQLAARFLLCHTLAHVLMRQLSLQSGYSSASLRERLFIGNMPESMCGIMIYTASPDSDGTLGGLQRQGKAGRFEETFVQAIESIRWCSSDPLCVEGVSSETEPTNLAACHSCVLTSETSCEEFNRYLDRGALVGIPGSAKLGFFTGLLADE